MEQIHLGKEESTVSYTVHTDRCSRLLLYKLFKILLHNRTRIKKQTIHIIAAPASQPRPSRLEQNPGLPPSSKVWEKTNVTAAAAAPPIHLHRGHHPPWHGPRSLQGCFTSGRKADYHNPSVVVWDLMGHTTLEKANSLSTQHWRSSHTLLRVCVSPHTLLRVCVEKKNLDPPPQKKKKINLMILIVWATVENRWGSVERTVPSGEFLGCLHCAAGQCEGSLDTLLRGQFFHTAPRIFNSRFHTVASFSSHCY